MVADPATSGRERQRENIDGEWDGKGLENRKVMEDCSREGCEERYGGSV